MNRGVLQMMAAGNPDWWSINAMRPPPTHGHHHHHQQVPPSPFFPFPQPPPPLPPSSTFFPHFIPTSSTSSSSPSSSSWHDNNQELPESWSQLLMGGLVGEEERGSNIALAASAALQQAANSMVDTKQENSASSYVYGHASTEDIYHHHQATKPSSVANYSTPHQIMAAASSPKSCVTTTSFGNNMLDFAGNKADIRQPPLDRSSECISSSTATGGGGALKKTRVQPSATQSTFKVRKEKLGDRITALHQLVSPFGKTDTASVLLEAIGYIRFLQSQIEALSMPYLDNGSSGNMRQQQQSVQGERNCIFPEDPGQLVNENSSKKRKGGPDHQDCNEEPKKDLKSRGLCLVPVSCTLQVGSDNGADYWAPPSLGGGFR